jgi:hypothetical protein
VFEGCAAIGNELDPGAGELGVPGIEQIPARRVVAKAREQRVSVG